MGPEVGVLCCREKAGGREHLASRLLRQTIQVAGWLAATSRQLNKLWPIISTHVSVLQPMGGECWTCPSCFPRPGEVGYSLSPDLPSQPSKVQPWPRQRPRPHTWRTHCLSQGAGTTALGLPGCWPRPLQRGERGLVDGLPSLPPSTRRVISKAPSGCSSGRATELARRRCVDNGAQGRASLSAVRLLSVWRTESGLRIRRMRQ